MQPGWPHPQHSRQAEAPEAAPRAAPSQATAVPSSHPTMECRAEINRFAVFLFCLLVPLGSMAPTQTSEVKVTAGLEHFTTEIPTYAAIIRQKAHELFQSYNNCLSGALPPEPCKDHSKGRDLAERIPVCQAFQPSCCALHHIQNHLKTLKGHLGTICPKGSTHVLEMNLSQLDITLSHGAPYFTCQDLPQVQPQSLTQADEKIYIWCVLKKYETIMQSREKL